MTAMTPIHQIAAAAGRSCGLRSQRSIPILLGRALSSTAKSNPPASSAPPLSQPQLLDERTLFSQISPLKRIICLCPVPLGRGRVSWSGGDSFYPEQDETVDLNFQSQQPHDVMRNVTQMQPLKVAKYRYGERFAIGVAVSDPYLTHATPVHLGDDGYGNDESKRKFSAEIVPTFRCDAHNLGSSPIFHTNLPFFPMDLLRHIGHFDIGAVVLALPMAPTRNPFCPAPTKVQLEQERKLDQVRECLMGVLQNYVTVEDDDTIHGDSEAGVGDADDNTAKSKRRPTPLGPLNLQGVIDHRLSITDVLAKTEDNHHRKSWNQISNSLREIQHVQTMGSESHDGKSNFHANREYGSHNVFQSVPPEMHAAVALTAMMEKCDWAGMKSCF